MIYVRLSEANYNVMQFSLDHKRQSHKQNQCFASDSVGLIFTKSYRSTLLITTPLLVKTSLKHHKEQVEISLFCTEHLIGWI